MLSDKYQPVVGQSYNLTCEINGAGNLNATFSFCWIKNNGTETPIKASIHTVFFPIFKLSDTGKFTCKVNVSSNYLDNVIAAHNVTHFRAQSKLFHLNLLLLKTIINNVSLQCQIQSAFLLKVLILKASPHFYQAAVSQTSV